MKYKDDPIGSIDQLDDLSTSEVVLFVKGFIQACDWIQEELSQAKVKLMEHAFDKDEHIQKKLLTYVDLLDDIEATTQKKVDSLNVILQEASEEENTV